MANPSFLLCFLVLSAALVNPISCARQFKQEEGHVPLFVLGDSLFDAGNNQYLNGSRKGGETSYPYGESFFNPPTGRLSDGRLVPDFIAQFAKLPVTTAYLKPGVHQFMVGSNFASAGSGVLVQTHPGTINLRTQLSYMKEVEKVLRQKLGDVETKRLLMRAVYLFSAGGNDYFDFFSKNPDAPQSYQQQYVNMVVGNLSQVLQEVYNMGGRKIAFQNAGPLGCLPAMKGMNPKLGSNCAEEPSSLSRLHNTALSNALKKLQTQLPGFRYSIFDYYNSLSERINNPSKYGFKEGKAACCGIGPYRGFGCGGKLEGKGNDYELCSNPSEYVWFDGGHTTERANLQLAELLWSGAPGVTGPCNLRELFGRL